PLGPWRGRRLGCILPRRRVVCTRSFHLLSPAPMTLPIPPPPLRRVTSHVTPRTTHVSVPPRKKNLQPSPLSVHLPEILIAVSFLAPAAHPTSCVTSPARFSQHRLSSQAPSDPARCRETRTRRHGAGE